MTTTMTTTFLPTKVRSEDKRRIKARLLPRIKARLLPRNRLPSCRLALPFRCARRACNAKASVLSRGSIKLLVVGGLVRTEWVAPRGRRETSTRVKVNGTSIADRRAPDDYQLPVTDISACIVLTKWTQGALMGVHTRWSPLAGWHGHSGHRVKLQGVAYVWAAEAQPRNCHRLGCAHASVRYSERPAASARSVR